MNIPKIFCNKSERIKSFDLVKSLPKKGIPLLLLLLGACSPETNEHEINFMNMWTWWISWTYFPVGNKICSLINEDTNSHGTVCSTELSKASIENIDDVRSKKRSLWIAQSDALSKVLTKDMGPELRSIFSLYTETVALITRKGSWINWLQDLAGKKIDVWNLWSGNERTVANLFSACNINTNQEVEISNLSPSDASKALRNNNIDAYFYTAGQPAENIRNIAEDVEINIIPLTWACIDKMVSDNNFFVKSTIVNGLYKGMTTDVSSFWMKAVLFAREDMNADIVYKITKSVVDKLKILTKLHPVLWTIKKESLINWTTLPLHEGALKYYKEIGLIKKNNLI